MVSEKFFQGKPLTFCLVHLDQLDISRIRTDYKVIDPEKLEEDEKEDDQEDDLSDLEESHEEVQHLDEPEPIPIPQGQSDILVEQEYALNQLNQPAEIEKEGIEEIDPFDRLMKGSISHEVSEEEVEEEDQSDKIALEGEPDEDSDDCDYENHNPSFLQIPDEEENDEKVEEIQEKIIEKETPDEEKIPSENSVEIPDENQVDEESGVKYFPPESNYLDELHQNLLEQERKEKEANKH